MAEDREPRPLSLVEATEAVRKGKDLTVSSILISPITFLFVSSLVAFPFLTFQLAQRTRASLIGANIDPESSRVKAGGLATKIGGQTVEEIAAIEKLTVSFSPTNSVVTPLFLHCVPHSSQIASCFRPSVWIAFWQRPNSPWTLFFPS